MRYFQLTERRLKEMTSNAKQRMGLEPIRLKKLIREDDRPTEAIMKQLKEEAVRYNFRARPEWWGQMQLQCTERAGDCYTWLANYFSLVSDMVPTNDGEYHIDRLHNTKTLYEEYCSAMAALNKQPYEHESFRLLRTTCFQHVKCRAYKAVSSKCTTCSRLAELRVRVS